MDDTGAESRNSGQVTTAVTGDSLGRALVFTWPRRKHAGPCGALSYNLDALKKVFNLQEVFIISIKHE